MNKIVRNIGIVIAALTLLFIAGVFAAWTTFRDCRGGEGPSALAACTRMVDYAPHEGVRVMGLVLRGQQYRKAGLNNEFMADMYAMVQIAERQQLPASKILPMYDSLASVNYKIGNSTEALKYADLAIQAGSTKPMSYLIQAAAQVAAQKYADALAGFQKAEKLGYKEPMVYFSIGQAYRRLGEYENAYKSLKSVESLFHGSEDAANLKKELGLTCYALKRYEEALPYLKEAVAAGARCDECSTLQFPKKQHRR